jgi:hypothetical protein
MAVCYRELSWSFIYREISIRCSCDKTSGSDIDLQDAGRILLWSSIIFQISQIVSDVQCNVYLGVLCSRCVCLAVEPLFHGAAIISPYECPEIDISRISFVYIIEGMQITLRVQCLQLYQHEAPSYTLSICWEHASPR